MAASKTGVSLAADQQDEDRAQHNRGDGIDGDRQPVKPGPERRNAIRNQRGYGSQQSACSEASRCSTHGRERGAVKQRRKPRLQVNPYHTRGRRNRKTGGAGVG